jgi:hypothetical protein
MNNVTYEKIETVRIEKYAQQVVKKYYLVQIINTT